MKCLSTLTCCPLAYSSSFTQLYLSYVAQSWGFWVTCGVTMMSLRQNDVIMSWLRLTATSNCLPHPHETLKSVWAHWYAWFCRCRHRTGVFAVVAQASFSPLFSWQRALAPLPSSRWHCGPSCQRDWPLNWREGPPLLHMHRQMASASALLPLQVAS